MADYMDANSSSEKPKWMQDPSLKGISMEKLDFLQKMVFESSSLSQKELMPFLMALAQKSRTANITFTQEEMTVIIGGHKEIQHSRGTDENESDNETHAAA